jgi:hypothetical protein
MTTRLFASGFIAFCLAAGPAAAQGPTDHPWSHGTTLSAEVGAATASGDTGLAAGGIIGWEITPHVGIDATVGWLDRNPGETGFSAAIGMHDTFKRLPLAPYVQGGFGMYIATFDPGKAASIPPFYADRMDGRLTHTFTDPAFFGQTGFDVFRNRRVSVRPTVGGMLVVHDAHSYGVGLFSVKIDYHFEEHPTGNR